MQINITHYIRLSKYTRQSRVMWNTIGHYESYFNICYHNPFLTYDGWSICSLMENIVYYELICRHIWFYFIISYLDTWAHISQYFFIRRNMSLHITVLVHMSTFGFLYEHMRLYVVKLINMLICEFIWWCMSSIVTKLLHIFQDEFKH